MNKQKMLDAINKISDLIEKDGKFYLPDYEKNTIEQWDITIFQIRIYHTKTNGYSVSLFSPLYDIKIPFERIIFDIDDAAKK